MFKNSLLKSHYSNQQAKNIKYPVLSVLNIHFLDNLQKLILKCGNPLKIEKSNDHICVYYNIFIFEINVLMCCSLDKNKLCSVNFAAEKISKEFIYNSENEINNDLMETSVIYEFNGKKYWELTDGVSNKHITMSFQNDKINIDMKFFNN